MNSEVSAEAAQACQRQKTSEKGSENSAEEEQRLGLKTYIKPEDVDSSRRLGFFVVFSCFKMFPTSV